MRMVFGLVLLVGIALAGGAVYLAKDRIAQYQAANPRPSLAHHQGLAKLKLRGFPATQYC